MKHINSILKHRNLIGFVKNNEQNFSFLKQFCSQAIFCARKRLPSVCLLSWGMGEEGMEPEESFFDHINNNNRDTGHSSWPDHLYRLRVLEQVQQVAAIFCFHLLTTWPCAFPGSSRWVLVYSRLLSERSCEYCTDAPGANNSAECVAYGNN